MIKPSFKAGAARRIGAVLLFSLAAYLALILLIADAGTDMIDRTIEHSRRLESDFKKTARYVKAFRAQRGRLPNDDEFDTWSERRLQSSRPFILDAGDGPLAQEAHAALGIPPRGGLVLAVWRGEWMEYHASWSGKSTMPLDESAYRPFGSRAADQWAGSLSLLVCLVGGFRLWKRRSPGGSAL